MTNDEIRNACDRSAVIANDFEYNDLRAQAFGVILSYLLGNGHRRASETEPRIDMKQPIASKKSASKSSTTGGLMSRIQELVGDGFFDHERTANELYEALRLAGWNHQPKEISARLIELVRRKTLRRAESREGKKTVYRYSNW